MKYLQKLTSFHLVERQNSKNIITWTYPTISEEQKNYILQHCFGSTENANFLCWRNGTSWFYVRVFADKLAVVVLAKEFQPQKYKSLCDILARKYTQTRNPVDLVELYLSLCISGSCRLQENSNLCSLKNFEAATNIKDLIKSFDLEIILIYTAILLKRRVIVFDINTKSLIENLWAISCLVPNRKTNDYLYPFVDNVGKLRVMSFFVVGTTDRNVIKDTRLYDLFVDMETHEIRISPIAEEIMKMSKTHKEIATFLVKLSNSDLSEKDVHQQIEQKTADLIHLLKSIASVPSGANTKMITLNDLKLKKYNPALENFLFNLALAENMMIF